MTPGDHAPDGVWLFDGVCNLCSGSVRLVLALAPDADISFTPIQSPYGRLLATQAGIDPDQPLSFAFFDHGRPLQKSAAVLALLGRVRAPWRWLRLAGAFPEPWRDGAYDWIAAHRYRIFGKRQTCVVPSATVRARFILDEPGS